MRLRPDRIASSKRATDVAKARAFEIHKRVGTESQPTLRAEREALSLLHFLRDQSQPQPAWLTATAIAIDQTISEPVRQRALQFAREWK